MGFFHKLLHNGLDNIVPIKTVRIHCNDAPWITGELKSLTRLRHRAYEQNSNTLYKFYRNLVNKERKLCRSNYYQTKVKDPHGKDSKKWWKECRRICGIERSQCNLDIKLLSNPSPTNSDMLTLASDINRAFLESQQRFDPLDHSYKVHKRTRKCQIFHQKKRLYFLAP